MVLTHRESARFIVAVQIPCHRKRRVRIGDAAIQADLFQLRQIFCRGRKHYRCIAVFKLGFYGFFHVHRFGLRLCLNGLRQRGQLRTHHFVKTRQTQGIVSNIGTFKHGRSLTCPRSLAAYGHQRRLEIARCMITRPRLLMLDEPAAGLNPQEKLELQGLIQRLRQEHQVTVLLIEHDMSLVMGVSERILVMEYGKPIALGTPDAIRSDERVIKAYLGHE